MRVLTKAALAVSTLTFFACSSPADTERAPVETGRTAQRMVGGQPSPSSQDSVVIIAIADGFCSGTLIAPNLVLTARHCVSDMNEDTECGTFNPDNDPSTMTVGIGADQDGENPNTIATGVLVIDDGQSSGCSHDLALIQLDQDIEGAIITPVRRAPLVSGEIVTAIGFGDNGHGQLTNGRYERGNLPVLAVGPTHIDYHQQSGQVIPLDVPVGEIATGESTCYGDSGGPIIDAHGAVVGVTSRGVVESCLDAPSVYSDISSHYDMIAQAAANAGHPFASQPPPTTDAGAPHVDAGPHGPDAGGSSSGGSSSGGSSSGSSGSSGHSSSSGGHSSSSSGSTGDNDGSRSGRTTNNDGPDGNHLSSAGCSVARGPSDASWLVGLLGLSLLRARTRTRKSSAV